MPIRSNRAEAYKPSKDKIVNWDTFRKGVNLLLQDTEIDGEELAQADNIMLVGRGIPTKRWGSALFYQAGNATGSVRGLQGMYYSDGTNELLALTDDGYLTKRNGSLFTQINGVSWASAPSGAQAYMAQLNDSMYIVNGRRELVRYSTPTLIGFPTISSPIIQGASNLSNATGSTTLGYRISAISQVGETLASATFELANQPDELGGSFGGSVRLQWTGVSTASGILQGFNIYGRASGNERFLAGVKPSNTNWIDTGEIVPREFTFPPTADSTGGPTAKYVIRFQDRLVFAGIDGEPSKVLISGKVPNHEKFDMSYGGNYILVEPDSGDDIVQLVGFADRIIVFKQRSIWQITLGDPVQIGNFFVTEPILKQITGSNGCIAPASVVPVNNDVYYLSRNGVRLLGYQANFTDVLRTNEISIKIRPFFKNLTIRQQKEAVAVFHDNKYLISFPGRGETMVFDTERAAWMGPWSLDSTVYEVYYDTDDQEHLLFAKDSSVLVDEYSSSFTTDKGVAIETTLKTRNENFGDWSNFKNIKDLFVQLRNVVGETTVDVRLEQRSGTVITAKSFDITASAGNSGWGADQWGNTQWGDSEADAGGVEAVFTIRWANLNKPARLMSLTFKTTDADAVYELLGVRAAAKPLSKGFAPSRWRIAWLAPLLTSAFSIFKFAMISSMA